MYNKFADLIGRTITKIKIDGDGGRVVFVTDNGPVFAYTAADCCSHTWIENVEFPALGLPCLVIAAEDIEMPDLGDLPGCDYVQYYGCKISTDKGDIIIDYRNDSNGYYGGDLFWRTK